MERGVRDESPVPGAPAGALRRQADSPGSESDGDLVTSGWGGGGQCWGTGDGRGDGVHLEGEPDRSLDDLDGLFEDMGKKLVNL